MLDFTQIDKLPTKPAGRKSEPSEYQELIRELAGNGEARKSPAISDIKNRVSDGKDGTKEGPSDAELLERELRRAGRQVGAKVYIRKSRKNAKGLVFVSFNAEPDPEKVSNGDSPEDADIPPEDNEANAGRKSGPRRVSA